MGGQGLAWAGMVLSSPARHWGAVGGKRWLAAGLAGTVSASWGELCARSGPWCHLVAQAGKQHQVDGVAWGSMLLDVEERSPALAGLAMAVEQLVKTTHLEQESTSSLWSLTSA